MNTTPRRLHAAQLGILAAICLLFLGGCASSAGNASPARNCYPTSSPIPGPVVFHPTAGQAGLYIFAGSGVYRLSTAGGALTPIWLSRMQGCTLLTPTEVGHVAGPLYDQPTISSGLTVANGMVYFSAWETSGNWVDLYAVHAASGTLAWKKRISDISTISGMLVLGDLVYIETGDAVHSLQEVNILQALNVRDGSVRWTYRYPLSADDVNPGLSSVGDGELFITGPHAYIALNATTGRKLWQVNLQPDQGSPTVSLMDGVLYVTSSQGCANCVAQPASSLVFAMNPVTGALLWQSRRYDGYLTPPMEVNGVVYVGSQDGHLYALRASDGAQLWASAAGGALYVTPQVANGLIYESTGPFPDTQDPTTSATHLLAFDVATGQQQWDYTFPPNRTDGSQPLFVGNGAVYTTSFGMHVDMLQAVTGKLLQEYTAPLSDGDLGLTLAS